MPIDAVADVVDAFENMFWLVMVAVKPITLLHPDPTDVFVPATKLTAVHCEDKSARHLSPGQVILWLPIPGTAVRQRHPA
jgi:hypothetical protein